MKILAIFIIIIIGMLTLITYDTYVKHFTTPDNCYEFVPNNPFYSKHRIFLQDKKIGADGTEYIGYSFNPIMDPLFGKVSGMTKYELENHYQKCTKD